MSTTSAAPAPMKKQKTTSHSSVKAANPVFKLYTAEEKKFYKGLDVDERERVAQAEREVCALNDVDTPMRFKVLCSQLADHLKAIAIKKLGYLEDLDASSSEYYKCASWIDAVCKLPIGKVKSLPFSAESPKHDIRTFLETTKVHMDRVVFGHGDAKDHIIRLLAQWIINPEAKGMVIGIHGPMGCGKTTLIKDSLCRVLDLPFAFIPLGGASDSSYLEGHSYTYEGACWGKIVDVLMKSGCANPIFYFDELDKVSDTSKGEEIVNVLMHLTDQAQNDKFHDKYFADFEFDLSKSLIMFSYNDAQKISPILRDRMTSIETKGYDVSDKVTIAKKHMIPSVLRQYMFKDDEVLFSEDIVKEIIAVIDVEDGVRNLKRAIQNIVSHVNLRRLTEESTITRDAPFCITSDDVKAFVSNRTKKDDMRYLSMYS